VLDRIKGTRLASNDKENLEDNEGILKMIFFNLISAILPL
jgi:hypothetical protein